MRKTICGLNFVQHPDGYWLSAGYNVVPDMSVFTHEKSLCGNHVLAGEFDGGYHIYVFGDDRYNLREKDTLRSLCKTLSSIYSDEDVKVWRCGEKMFTLDAIDKALKDATYKVDWHDDIVTCFEHEFKKLSFGLYVPVEKFWIDDIRDFTCEVFEKEILLAEFDYKWQVLGICNIGDSDNSKLLQRMKEFYEVTDPVKKYEIRYTEPDY